MENADLPLVLSIPKPSRQNPICPSSEPEALESKDLDHAPLIEIFSKTGNPDEIKAELESIDLSVDYETVLSVLRILDQDPETARRFFDWVSETDNGKLSSKSYNLMLRILGRKDYLKEFWDLVSTMKKKGYGISKITFEMVSDNFNKEGMLKDLDTLKEMYNTPRPMEDSLERVCLKVCKVIREDEWGESVKAKLEDFGTGLSNDLISTVLERIEIYPSKALMFFRWAEENPSFKHNAKTYNLMASILAREDSIDDFWVIVNEMKDAGYEMEMPTYVKVSGRFFKRKMLKDAVDLYEYMMGCSDKPPAQDCMFLLRKIVVGENPDMDLFSRVMRVFTDRGNVLTRTIFDGVLKSLTGAGKLGECDKILKAMEDGGFVANSAVYSQVVLGLCKAGKLDEACEFLEEREAAGHDPDLKAWASLIQGFCAAGEMDKAASRFRRMVEKKGAVDAGGAFEVLVNGFCLKNREADACKLLIEMVNRNQLRPWHVTYKMLVEKLLAQKSLKEALSLLGLMKSHGFPPYIDPFISYISKSGSGDDAVSFLKAMSVKRFPSTSVFVRMFEEFFKAGRHNAAHDFLSKSPGYIRGHADVLNLFCSMKTEEAATAASVA
ncbi:pentatricopeptide repeat-containing protein At3g02490, mitochondrial-like isoform X2 [Magnolia sinica]|uniref:pentatricopeptide repeat-containing protein At3g02490, mitochondrial-like isoform X2 n=1 Tax=Magnolia sinica TaxID=86752 RepID=UPI00265B24BB|nr:pentatricopeptide repeat-containing protein At3g02490, mitochondrial-like isoform X2 [Magnolia sinica]